MAEEERWEIINGVAYQAESAKGFLPGDPGAPAKFTQNKNSERDSNTSQEIIIKRGQKMDIKKYRGTDFINREQEIKFLKDWFSKEPAEILWLYGPKSTGKTTLIEYVIEKELIKDFKAFNKSNYWIKYINFRRMVVSSYSNFLESFFEVEDEQEINKEIDRFYNLGIFKLNAKTLKKIRAKEKNLFNELIKKLQEINKKKIIVIDEIQLLEDIYINGEKELLKEFLNFCVALTKELHLSHIVILSSNTIFINTIYNDAKLKQTSQFELIDHLDKTTMVQYLMLKGFKSDKIDIIWDYFGGCIAKVNRLLRNKDRYESLKEYLDYELKIAISEIKHIFRMEMDYEEIDIFKDIIKK